MCTTISHRSVASTYRVICTVLFSSNSLIGSDVGNWKIGGATGICIGYLYRAQPVQEGWRKLY